MSKVDLAQQVREAFFGPAGMECGDKELKSLPRR
jgi:hypothetical protein